MLERLRTLFETRVDRDGQAEALEHPATPLAASEPPVAEPDGGSTRRERRLGLPRDLLHRQLSEKVLHGWLQNRHQVLVPLTFRLGRLQHDDAAALLHFAALCLLSSGDVEPSRVAESERWLRAGGADEDALAVFRAALDQPPALHVVVATLRARSLGAYGYAAAVGLTDTREPVAHAFATWVAARFELPVDAVRSVDRRYRR